MKDTLAPQVRFGGFELDVRRAELRNGVGAISLQEQPFQILLMLVERDGEIVTREEIQRKLWPDDTVVEFDQSINAAIKKLRKALGDSADEPRYIRTVAKQGYRLIMPVERVSGNGTAVEFPAAGEATASTGAKKAHVLPMAMAAGRGRRRFGGHRGSAVLAFEDPRQADRHRHDRPRRLRQFNWRSSF